MKRLLLALLLVSPIHAQSSGGATQVDVNYFPLVVETVKPDHSTWRSFEMRDSSCLRGPLRFIDADGKIVFELTEGAEYPSGCSKGNCRSRGESVQSSTPTPEPKEE